MHRAVFPVDMLLNHQHLTLQHADVVAAALVRYRAEPTTALSDYLRACSTIPDYVGFLAVTNAPSVGDDVW